MDQAYKPKIIFMGTPLFAYLILKKIDESGEFDIQAVFTRPDKKKGRGYKLIFSEVKEYALQRNFTIYQPSNLKGERCFNIIKNLEPDFIIVAAYGLLLPSDILELPKFSCVNVHASLLPEYRGAAPIQRAIMDKWPPNSFTGVSIMKMEPELDAGPVYGKQKIFIDGKNAVELEEILANKGGELLIKILWQIIDNKISPISQDLNGVSFAPKLTKSDSNINFDSDVECVDSKIRALAKWPFAKIKIDLKGKKDFFCLKILQGKIVKDNFGYSSGTIFQMYNRIFISCKNGSYELDLLVPEGKKIMKAVDFFRGQMVPEEGILGYVVS